METRTIPTLADLLPDLAPQIAREHASVRAAVGALAGEIARLRENPNARSSRQIASLLGALQAHLVRHFALEEQAGLLAAAAADPHPGPRRAAAVLVGDHRRFERDLTCLLATARRARSGAPGANPGLAARFETFLTDLDRHERREDELLREILGRESG